MKDIFSHGYYLYVVPTDLQEMESFALSEAFSVSFWSDEGCILGIENIQAYHLKPCELLYLRQTSIIRVSMKLHLELLFYPPKSFTCAIYFV